ncbi:hypothetical protein [Streptomyces griseoaurantiacus]|uniref:hypothetical protein n=1 Tax=Streptomyces griseoaurantiacus TaxID=68213 RepID=UPI0036CB9114
MNTLKRFVDLTGSLRFFYAFMGFWTSVVTLAWAVLLHRYGLREFTHQGRPYALGAFAALSGMVYVTAAVGLLTTWIDQRSAAREPLPVDPDNPPEKVLGVHVEGEPPVRCDCHGKPIKDNAEIWLWPQPTKIICASEDGTE